RLPSARIAAKASAALLANTDLCIIVVFLHAWIFLREVISIASVQISSKCDEPQMNRSIVDPVICPSNGKEGMAQTVARCEWLRRARGRRARQSRACDDRI